jgi:hypothetical protein
MRKARSKKAAGKPAGNRKGQTDRDAMEVWFEVNRLVQGWMYRDLSQWDELRTLFHKDGTVGIAWFDGKFSDFVDASAEMRKSEVRSKHLIGSPVVEREGDRVVAETSAILAVENGRLKLGCIVYGRFLDLIERRNGVWKIWRRQGIYDLASFTFPAGPVEIDAADLEGLPSEYAALGYLLIKGGFPVTSTFPTRGSEREKSLKQQAGRWLKTGSFR